MELPNSRHRFGDAAITPADPLVSDLLEMAAPYVDDRPPTRDVVHADFKLEHVLVAGGRIVGVIDFDDAGRGDRAIDLASLLYDAIRARADANVVEYLLRRTLDRTGLGRLAMYLVAYTLIRLIRAVHGADEASLQAHLAAAQSIVAMLRRPDLLSSNQ